MRFIRAALMLSGAFLVTFGQQGPSSDHCQTTKVDPQAPEYRVAQTLDFRSLKHEGKLEVFISVNPEQIARKEMIALAHQLNLDFCKENRLYVRILDDYDIARNVVPAAHERSIFERAWRGEYYLDRAKGEEVINFSSAPGKAIDEVKITLGIVKRHKGRSPSKPR